MEYLDILRLIKEKDKAGVEALYTTYGRKFYVYAIKRWQLGEDAAWEVVYKTLDTLFSKLPEYPFESKAHFENFIFKVFINFLRQYFRRHRKHQFDEVSLTVEFGNDFDDEEEGEASQPGPYEMDQQAFREYFESDEVENPKLIELRKALEELDENDREILLLRAQNYSYDEIAAMLQIENKQLKVKHHRAKKKLKQLLSQKTNSHV
jgi:RNA polymerase sigma-70 factor (ECF subfamily)